MVFGLNGDHVLRLYDGLADLGGITHVTVKHENNAALAAEAYGRLTGRPGVALTTAGPGALNSISGVASAMASGAPLVSLTGAVPNDAALETFHGVDEVDFTERAFAADRQVLAPRHPRRRHPGRNRRRLRAGGRRPSRPDPRRGDPRRPRG